jgi:predicted ArsR family transcriptional regulator
VARSKVRTRDRILDSLRRRGPLTAAELARTFRLSCTALRLQLAALEEEGIVRAVETRPSRGRPSRVYDLTAAARDCFPDRAGAMALEILREVESLGGRDLVVRALEGRARRLAEAYLAQVEGKSHAERVRTVARLRDGEGYLAETVGDGPRGPRGIVERHCPIASLAERWPEVCRLEEELIRRVLGPSVRREEHLLSGGRCCRYSVDEV